MTEDDSLLYLARSDVQDLSQSLDVVAIFREVFRLHASKGTILPDEACLRWAYENEQVRSLVMPAYVGGRFNAAGTKIINGNVLNIERGIPRADGLTVIYDSRTGRISCVMEGAYLSALRTAAVTMLAVELLAAPGLESLAIIGAGVLAESHLLLLPRYLPQIARVALYDLKSERAANLQARSERYFANGGPIICVEDSAEAAIRPADLVIAVTTTTQSYIKYDWLKAGCVAVNVSLDDMDPEVMLRADLLVVDDWNLVRNDDKRLLGRMFRSGQIVGPNHTPEGALGARAVDAELGEIVCNPRSVRRAPDDIVVVNPFGVAIEDVSLAVEILRLAKAKGLGIQLQR